MIAISLTNRPYVRWKTVSYSETAVGTIALIICILAESTFNGFAKELSGSFTPLSLIFVSELLTATFIALSFGLLPTIRTLGTLSRKQTLTMLMIGLLAGVLGPLLFFTGLAHTTAINASFFSRFELIFVIALAHFFLNEKVTRVHWIGLATILAGIMMIALRGFTDHINFKVGDLIITLGILSYSCAHMLYRRHLREVQPHVPLFVRTLCAMAAFFLMSPFIEVPFIDQVRALESSVIPALIGFAFIARFLSSMSFYQAIDRLPMTAVSLSSSLTIVGSTFFAFFYLGEQLHWYHFAGALMIILGNALVEILGHKKPAKHVEHRLAQRIA
jgi:drug/metabolite transporter (DMT)-like permease